MDQMEMRAQALRDLLDFSKKSLDFKEIYNGKIVLTRRHSDSNQISMRAKIKELLRIEPGLIENEIDSYYNDFERLKLEYLDHETKVLFLKAFIADSNNPGKDSEFLKLNQESFNKLNNENNEKEVALEKLKLKYENLENEMEKNLVSSSEKFSHIQKHSSSILEMMQQIQKIETQKEKIKQRNSALRERLNKNISQIDTLPKNLTNAISANNQDFASEISNLAKENDSLITQLKNTLDHDETLEKYEKKLKELDTRKRARGKNIEDLKKQLTHLMAPDEERSGMNKYSTSVQNYKRQWYSHVNKSMAKLLGISLSSLKVKRNSHYIVYRFSKTMFHFTTEFLLKISNGNKLLDATVISVTLTNSETSLTYSTPSESEIELIKSKVLDEMYFLGSYDPKYFVSEFFNQLKMFR